MCVDREARVALYPSEVELDPDVHLQAILDTRGEFQDDMSDPGELIVRSKDVFDIFLHFSAYTINESLMQSPEEVLMSSFHCNWNYEPPYTVVMQVTDVAKWSHILGQRTVDVLKKLPTCLEVTALSIRIFGSPVLRRLIMKHPGVAASVLGLFASGVRPSAGWLEDFFTRNFKESSSALRLGFDALFTRSSDEHLDQVRERNELPGTQKTGSDGTQALNLGFDPHLAYG